VLRKDAFDPYMVGHLAHREGSAGTTIATPDDHPLENLDSLLLTLPDAIVYLDGIADPEVRKLAALLELKCVNLREWLAHVETLLLPLGGRLASTRVKWRQSAAENLGRKRPRLPKISMFKGVQLGPQPSPLRRSRTIATAALTER
jgi:hypothetical protein